MQGRVPLQRGGVPRSRRSNGAMAQTSDKVEEEKKLSGREKDSPVGDVLVKWKRGGEHASCGVGNLAELSIVARLACQTGEVHRQKRCVGSDEGQPEVPSSDSFRHKTSRAPGGPCELREPIIRRSKEAEDARHGHDEVKVSDDEGGVVQILIQDGLGQDRAGEASR